MLSNFSFLLEQTPIYLIFWVAQNCNFNCEHCFNHKENKRKTSELDIHEIDRIASSLGHVKYLTLAGGEPFLRSDLYEVSKIFVVRNRIHTLNVVTNGWKSNEVFEFCQRFTNDFPEVLLTLNISIEGFKNIHDEIRNKEGSFDRNIKLLERLKTIVAPNFEVAVNTVYCAKNADTLEKFSDWIISDLGVPVALNLIRGRDLQDPDLKNIDIDHYLHLSRSVVSKNLHLRKKNRSLGMSRLFHGITQKVLDIAEASVKENKMIVKCRAGKKAIVLTAAGDVVLCEILGITLGNVREFNYDLPAVLGTESSRAEIKKIIQSKCHCTWECFQSVNVVFSPKNYPGVVLKSI